MISPFMPVTAERIWQQLNLPQEFGAVQLADIREWGGTPKDLHVGKPEQLFPRIEVEKKRRRHRNLSGRAGKRRRNLLPGCRTA